MQKRIATITSYIFHPLLMPTIGLLILFFSGTYISLLPFEAKKIIIIVVAINTMVLPLLMMPLFYRLNIIKSLQMHSNKERITPLGFTLIPFIFSIYFLKRLPIPDIISSFMIGAAVTVAIALVVSIWWKISIHMLGIGGLAGLIHVLSLKFYVDVIPFLTIVIALAGILAWARLSLNSHKPFQVYIGFIAGWISVVSCIMFL